MQNQNSSLPVKYEFDVANVMKSFLIQTNSYIFLNKTRFFLSHRFVYGI